MKKWSPCLELTTGFYLSQKRNQIKIEHVGLVELQLGAVEISQEAEVDIGDEFVEETSDVDWRPSFIAFISATIY